MTFIKLVPSNWFNFWECWAKKMKLAEIGRIIGFDRISFNFWHAFVFMSLSTDSCINKHLLMFVDVTLRYTQGHQRREVRHRLANEERIYANRNMEFGCLHTLKSKFTSCLVTLSADGKLSPSVCINMLSNI